MTTIEEMGGLEACANRAANLEALQDTQPRIAADLHAASPQLDWCYARDGALTARTPDGKWWSGCSVPRAAALAMFGKLDVHGTTACFLAPVHPAQLAVALEKLRHDQAIIAIAPDPHWLAVALHLTDFSADIRGHRLWFAAGDDWGLHLERLFDQYAGLPTPQQFIRTGLLGEHDAARLMTQAERTVTQINESRASWIEAIRQSLRPSPGPNRRVLILRPSRFRLYDASAALAATLEADASVECRALDSDDPASVSGLSLAITAAECDLILVADRGRGDLPAVLSTDMPVITWITTGRVPAITAAGPRDALLLADPNWRRAAQVAGWPAGRIRTAGWPSRLIRASAAEIPALALIADTQPVTDLAEEDVDLSSHRLLWDTLRQEISANPLCVGGDPANYLHATMQRLGVSPEGLDARRFIEGLMIPSWQQSIALQLIRAGIPLHLFGDGWDEIDTLRDHWRGAIASDAQFDAAVAAAAALVPPLPLNCAHAVSALSRPSLDIAPATPDQLIDAARRLLRGSAPRQARTHPTLSASLLHELLA